MKELELFNCNGLACVSLKNYNDALEEIIRLNTQLEDQSKLTNIAINRKNKYKDIITELEKWLDIEENYFYTNEYNGIMEEIKRIKNKLKELKENK